MSRVETRSQTSRCTCKLAADREERWRRIRDDLRDCMDRGEHPCGERAKAVAVAARLLISEIAGADSRVSMILKVLARLSAPVVWLVGIPASCNISISPLAGWRISRTDVLMTGSARHCRSALAI